jgi:hypothetical protein
VVAKNPYDLSQLDLRPQGFVDGSLHPIFKIAARKDSDVLESSCPEIASDPLALATTDHGDVRLSRPAPSQQVLTTYYTTFCEVPFPLRPGDGSKDPSLPDSGCGRPLIESCFNPIWNGNGADVATRRSGRHAQDRWSNPPGLLEQLGRLGPALTTPSLGGKIPA